jgi:gas vesicle protein
MELLAAVLGGFVGALIGLLIALLGQSREDDRLRRAEEWRQQTAKRERLREEFDTALRLVYEVQVSTAIFQRVPPPGDPAYTKRREELEALYDKAKSADLRLRLEGATVAWRAMAEVAKQHQRYTGALRVMEDPRHSTESDLAARTDLREGHEAIAAIAETLHETLAGYLEALTPPGPPPAPSGLRSWVRQAEEWLRR